MKMQMSKTAKFFLYLFLIIVTLFTLFPLAYTVSASVKTNSDIASGKTNLIPEREKNVYERDTSNGEPLMGTLGPKYQFDDFGQICDRSMNPVAIDDEGFLLSDPESNVYKKDKSGRLSAKLLPEYHHNEEGKICDANGNVLITNARGDILTITDDNIYRIENGKPVTGELRGDYTQDRNGKVYNELRKQVLYDENGYIYTTEMEKYFWTYNYQTVWGMSGTTIDSKTTFADYTVNSLKVAALSVVLTTTFTAMSAYCFQRGRFPGKTFLYWFFLATMFIGAGTITIFPILQITTRIGINNWWGLAIVLSATGGASNLFLTMGYLKTIPKELDESAKIDGCTFFSTWLRIILPLSVPILGTIALMTFRGSWNNWMLPRLMLASDQTATTLVVAIVNLANNGGAGASQYNLMMAGSMLSMAPMLIMFLIMNETFVEGITQGSVKG